MPADALNRETLVELAHAYGVDHEFWEANGTYHLVSNTTLVQVLNALGVQADSDTAMNAELAAAKDRDWRRVLPPTTVVRSDRDAIVEVHVPHGAKVHVWVDLESGYSFDMEQVDDFTEPRKVNGVLTGQASYIIHAGLELGYHTIHAEVTSAETGETRTYHAMLISTPASVDNSRFDAKRSWGMMVQLYSVRSGESWGIGDLADLAEMAANFGHDGADFVLINPLHAAEPQGHMSPSPYLPVTRRFFNPIYLRPEDVHEYAYLSAPQRSLVAWAGEKVKAASSKNELIDRDAAWQAKREALEVIYFAGRSRGRQQAFERYRKMEGQGLEDFALWCALQERFEGRIPERFASINSPQVAQIRQTLAERIDFWAWLQWLMDEQLSAAQAAARSAGMRFGIFHDLAVGVHPVGSDVWTIPHAFAPGVSVGAPPDMYNQQGQNWSQPPWNPVALDEMGYAPLRDMARTVLRHAGALRIDHVMGLFRLWWIPQGNSAVDGTYVRFNHEAMVGVLVLEAHRASAVLVGEDLGTVEPWVREYLAERGIMGTSVFWFEKDSDGGPAHPHDYRKGALASVDTHDLPPAAGYLAEEHVDLRDRLGLLTEPVAEVHAEATREREQVIARLRDYGLVGEQPSERELIEAMHAYVCAAPSNLVGVSLTDAVGERRAQNQPGTDQEYPNWRVPLADGTEKVVMVEDVAAHPRYLSLVNVLNKAM